MQSVDENKERCMKAIVNNHKDSTEDNRYDRIFQAGVALVPTALITRC